ncbi:MAG: EamA family transporter [Methylococcaceae bacterium]|nr:EamA family transporter [Methylococcaceae bacterium]
MEFDPWYLWAITGMLAAGISSFVLRLAAENRVNTNTVRLVLHLMVFCGSVIAFLITDAKLPQLNLEAILYVAVAQGLLFSFSVFLRMEAIKRYAPSFVVFSVFQFKVLPVIFISIVFLDEWSILTDIPRVIGILLALIAIYLVLDLGTLKNTYRNPVWLGTGLAILGMLFSAIVTVLSKVAVDNNPLMNLFFFMMVVNAVTLVCGVILRTEHDANHDSKHGKAAFYGAIMGGLTFLGFYSFLRAFAEGSLSQISSINSMGILVPIILGNIFFGEKLKIRVEIALFIAVASLILIG